MVVACCVSAVLEWSGDHENGKEEVSSEGLVYREVLTGRRFFVTSVKVATTVGLVWRHSRPKDVYLVVLLGVPNSHCPVLGTPKWWVIHLCFGIGSSCFFEVGHPVYAFCHTTLREAEWGFGLLSFWPLSRWRWVFASLADIRWLECWRTVFERIHLWFFINYHCYCDFEYFSYICVNKYLQFL